MTTTPLSGRAGPTAAVRAEGRFARNRWVGLVGAGVWLFYLENTLSALVRHGGWAAPLGIAALVAFAAVYLVGIARLSVFRPRDRNTALAWGYVATLVGCALLTVPGAGDQSLVPAVFVAAAAMATLPRAHGIGVAAALFVVCEVVPTVVPGWHDRSSGFTVLLASLAVGFLRMAFARAHALQAAQAELAEAAVAAERTRIARDLHDILGHSLTVITVKAELARRLFDIDPPRARAEVTDLERLSRDALADVRSTALGLRGVSLAGELAAAYEALESAGIEASLPATADDVPSARRELFAWVLREAVTNVVRHSRARHCVVELGAARLAVRDDGVGLPATIVPPGHGLAGVRQRVADAGATVRLEAGLGGAGASVLVEVPR